VLLDDDVLAPASLADRDSGRAEAMAEIARELAATARREGRPLEVAELGGRDGRTAEHLLGLLSPEDVRYTLLDPSPAMIASARTRLGEFPHHCEYQVLRGAAVPAQLRHRFDVVIASDALHRYADASHGPALAAMLIRRGGSLLAVERTELAPLALLTSALLDRGYAGFDAERRRAGSPMLPAERWGRLLASAGLDDVAHRPIGSSFAVLLTARRPLGAVDLDSAVLRELAGSLLPSHMVPDSIEVLPWLPLTANGKVDRSAIAALVASTPAAPIDEEPRGGTERAVAELWSELLGVPVLGRMWTFFELGGDSLLATRFIEQVRRRFGVDLPLRRMFAEPALAHVAAALAEASAAVEMEEGAL
jgi:yersiniabactin nonribosomal peptide synthetase